MPRGLTLLRLTLALLIPGSVEAQGVLLRGSVSLPDGSRAPQGIIVVARSATRPTIVRALTDASGAFEMRVEGPGRYSVSALRIGHEPSAAVSVDAGATGAEGISLTLSLVPVRLTGITVSARDECRVSPDSGLMVSRVWQEARKALVGAQLNEGRALDVEWMVYDRELDRSGEMVLGQEVTLRSERTPRAFRSAPAAQLHAAGYVVTQGDEVEYFAPDAEVLLSDEFAGSHCLRLREGPAGRESLIGVGFRPTRSRDRIRDIEGTLWLDRQSAELRSLEYRYTNLPEAAQRAAPGGTVEYTRVPGAGWLVTRWSIRMPIVGADSSWRTSRVRRNISAVVSVRATVSGVLVSGGVVTKVASGDSVLHATPMPGLRLRVRGGGTHVAMGSIVELDGTNAASIVDSAGEASFMSLLAGRYRAFASSPLMDSLAMAPSEWEVEVAAQGVTLDSVALPDERRIAQAICGRPLAGTEGVLRGFVRDDAGTPRANVAVTASWIGGSVTAIRDGTAYSATQRALGTFSDSLGRWRICGVPLVLPLTVRGTDDERADRQVTELERGQVMRALDLRMVPARGVAAREVAPDLGTGSAELEIYVRSAEEMPIVDARVSLEPPEGKTLTGRTNSAGRVIFPLLRPGAHTLDVRRLGYAPGTVVLAIGEGRNTAPVILDKVNLPTLDTVRVVAGRRTSTRHDAFDTRRARGDATVSFGAEEIERRKPAWAWQLLESVPSLRVERGPDGVAIFSTRTQVRSARQVGGNTPAMCWTSVVVDGVMLPGSPPDLALLPRPEDIHGMEVFAGPARVPQEYAGTGGNKWCGLVMIWTK